MLGVVIRSRFNQNVEEENASLFHAGREFKNAKNDINKLKVGNSIVEDPVTTEKEVTSFFSALFNGFHDTNLLDTGRSFVPNPKFENEFLGNLGHLNGQDSLNLVQPVSLDELELVIKNCANNKSPGLDGLSYELYKILWPIIGQVSLK